MLLPFNTEEHLKLVAELHYKALPWSTNSQLGKEHIYNIFKALADLPSTFGFVWMHEGQMVGFSIGSMDYLEARKAIRSSYSTKNIVQLIIKSLLKPLYFIIAFETVFVVPQYLKRCGTKAEWIAWSTDMTNPKYPIAAIQCFLAIKKYYAKHGQPYFIAQGERRSERSAAFLSKIKNIKKKYFYTTVVYILNSHNQ